MKLQKLANMYGNSACQFLRATIVVKSGMDGLLKSSPVMKLSSVEGVINIIQFSFSSGNKSKKRAF